MASLEEGDSSRRFGSSFGASATYSSQATTRFRSEQQIRLVSGEFERICSELPIEPVLLLLQEAWGERMEIVPFEEVSLGGNGIGMSIVINGLRSEARVPYLRLNSGAKKPEDTAVCLNLADGRVSTSFAVEPTGFRSTNLVISDSGFLKVGGKIDPKSVIEKYGLKGGIDLIINERAFFSTGEVKRKIPLGIKTGEETTGTRAQFARVVRFIKWNRLNRRNTPPEIRERTLILAGELGIDLDGPVEDGVIAITVKEIEDKLQAPWILSK